jgi:hypothetical protein
MDDISEQFRKRDRIRRRLAAQMTPEQRLECMAELQAYAWQTLQQNPEALDRFWRRNLRQRAARLGARGTL